MMQDTTQAIETDTAATIAEHVRERYADAALRVQGGGDACCSTSCCATADGDVISSALYDALETEGLPEEAVLASLGCGNPTALISLIPGQTVLDLGSGGGIDVLLSAKRVGPHGFVYGLDMTDEMLALAQKNKDLAGAANVAFLKGRIEAIPLPADSVDVVISNCVINLAVDKGQVLREAFRVLKQGGHFAVSDVVADGAIHVELRRNMEAWVGCLAGALEIREYKALLDAAGFTDVDIEITRRYTVAQAGLDVGTLPADWQEGDGKLASAFIHATKPVAAEPLTQSVRTPPSVSTSEAACCGPECCS